MVESIGGGGTAEGAVMSFDLKYVTVMTELSGLAMSDDTPSYVRERALTTLVRELSPLHARHDEVLRELGQLESEEPGELVSEMAEASKAAMKARVGKQEEDEEGKEEEDEPL